MVQKILHHLTYMNPMKNRIFTYVIYKYIYIYTLPYQLVNARFFPSTVWVFRQLTNQPVEIAIPKNPRGTESEQNVVVPSPRL